MCAVVDSMCAASYNKPNLNIRHIRGKSLPEGHETAEGISGGIRLGTAISAKESRVHMHSAILRMRRRARRFRGFHRIPGAASPQEKSPGGGSFFVLRKTFRTASRGRERSDQRKAAKLKKVAEATFLNYGRAYGTLCHLLHQARPKRFLKRSTRPPVSTSFCLPV